MPRPFSSVTAAAIASIVTMAVFALWAGHPGCETAACFGPGCAREAGLHEVSAGSKPLGLIDL